MRDPHRGQCLCPNEDLSPHPTWHEELDWAVYHAPGWEQWQDFRRGLLNHPMGDRTELMRMWPRDHMDRADVIRVLNLTRSLRGQWKAYPEIVELNEELNNVYRGRING